MRLLSRDMLPSTQLTGPGGLNNGHDPEPAASEACAVQMTWLAVVDRL